MLRQNLFHFLTMNKFDFALIKVWDLKRFGDSRVSSSYNKWKNFRNLIFSNKNGISKFNF